MTHLHSWFFLLPLSGQTAPQLGMKIVPAQHNYMAHNQNDGSSTMAIINMFEQSIHQDGLSKRMVRGTVHIVLVHLGRFVV
jgi:hypothetical protein